MGVVLAPAPNALQLHSPALGPWFDDNSVNLTMPATGELDVQLTLNGVSWLPPASGTLSFFVATTNRPKGLVGLRAPDGTPAFSGGSFIAIFRLLSWVERRLDALTTAGMASIANPATVGSSTRPIVRSLAMEFRANPPVNMAAVRSFLPADFVFPAGVTTDEDQAANLGLTWDGTTLGNGLRPMSDLHQPVASPLDDQKLLTFPASTNVRLWAFDHRGRPIDPGAVATWWNFLATVAFNNLWADVLRTRTVSADDGLTIHLVNAHEGPLDAPFDPSTSNRLNITNGDGSTNVVQAAANANNAVSVGFTNAPIPNDNFPQPLAAVVPDGQYSSLATAWLNGPNNRIPRDFCRIGVMSVEHDLVGQKRVAPDSPTDTQTRRAADQNRPSTGVRPGRSLRGALLAGGEATLNALGVVAGGPLASTLVASIVDRDAGPVPVPGSPNTPIQAPTLTASALDGGGIESGSIALGQRILVTVTFNEPGPFTGAWVRIWPLGFDPDTGEHVRLDGGGAVVDANNQAYVVAPLPDGTVADPNTNDPEPSLGLDVMVSTAPSAAATPSTEILFPDQRISRPYPTGSGIRIDIADATPPFVVCSTGVQYASAPLPNAAVPSGSEVVALGGVNPELIDRATIAAAAFPATAIVNLLGANDTIQLTEPAFQTQDAEEFATGETPPALSENSTLVTETTRQPFSSTGFWTAGFPLPGMERLEVVMSQPDDPTTAANGAAVVGSTPLLGPFHVLPQHAQGHPGNPGSPGVHGNGVLVQGSAAVAMAEYTRDRTIGSTGNLLTSAYNNPISNPGTPNANSLWIAGLRTEAAGVASELAYDLLSTATGDPYPFDGTLDDIINWLTNAIAGFPGSLPPTGSIVSALRAVNQRILTAAYGAREGATAMLAAINRAEDFIYIETPALDNLSFGDDADGDSISLWQALMDRMDANPSLHAAVCLPFHLLPGAPEPLQFVRDGGVSAALTAMAADSGNTNRAERFVAFSPTAGPARSLRIAGTTVVVDDAIAIVGTTHLWRRGLSFDSSYAAAVFDEQQQRGRSAQVLAFRMAIMAAQLDINAAELPLDPTDTIRAIGELVERGGFQRLAPEHIRPPDPTFTTVDPSSNFNETDIWNPDGSFPGAPNPFQWLLGLQTGVYNDIFNPPGA